MKTFFLTILFCALLITAPPTSGQDLPPKPALQLLSQKNNEPTKELFSRVQMELDQIAQNMDAIDAGMMQAIAGRPSIEKSRIKAHELLKSCKPGQMVQDFFNASSSDLRWGLCLKTGKLYMGLLDLIFEMNQDRRPDPGKNSLQFSVADEYPEVVQLSFLARMMTELELRFSQLQLQEKTSPAEKQQQRWRLLRSSLLKDDQTYLDQLKILLAKTGTSPGQFAAKIIQDARRISPAAESAVMEGMNTVDPPGDLWRLAEIPGINPDFIQAMSCDKAKMREFISAGSLGVLIQACNCRYPRDGSFFQAFAAKPFDRASSPDLAGKIQTGAAESSAEPRTLRLPKDRSILDQLNPDKTYPKTGADLRQDESKGGNFGATYTPVPQQKIPPGWIRCECPDDHPDAGMVVNGVRWHAPVLHCPNPELKLREHKQP